MKTIFHTKIKVKTIAKNGSERFGANAECKMWTEGSELKIEISQHGKTKHEAEEKLLQTLSNNGANKVECVDDKNKIHDLKTWPEFFQAVKKGDKNFDVRKNDRESSFKVGDTLKLREFIPADKQHQNLLDGQYTGEVCYRKICYILEGGKFGIQKGFVVLGLVRETL